MFFECVMSAYMALCADTNFVDSCRGNYINCVAKELVSRDKVDREHLLDMFNQCEMIVFGKEIDKKNYKCY